MIINEINSIHQLIATTSTKWNNAFSILKDDASKQKLWSVLSHKSIAISVEKAYFHLSFYLSKA